MILNKMKGEMRIDGFDILDLDIQIKKIITCHLEWSSDTKKKPIRRWPQISGPSLDSEPLELH